MKTPKKTLIPHVINFLCIFLIILCFVLSITLVRRFAQDSCFERIEETTVQISTMFNHAMNERLDKLTVFADILAANNENPEPLLKTYMENFCRTQYFAALCIHRANGTIVHYGEHPHNQTEYPHTHLSLPPYEEEVQRLPYVSEVFFNGLQPEENYFAQAVPIVRGGETIAVLYGYTALDVLPGFIASSAYEGKCQFYVVDGDTGNFLMDEYHGQLGNIYDGSMGPREVMPGYEEGAMVEGVKNGEQGFYVFRSQRTDQWYYTCYMPLGINNWSMQLTIDESTAFRSYHSVQKTMLGLMTCVILLMLGHLLILMSQNAQAMMEDKHRLRRAALVNRVQRDLINAHNDPSCVIHALRVVAEALKAESVWLMTFSGSTVSAAYSWPSWQEGQADDLTGRHLRDEVPGLYAMLASGKTAVYQPDDPASPLSGMVMDHFRRKNVHRMSMTPVMDTRGVLTGAIAVVNAPAKTSYELVEAVTYDFFMAIANLENHAIIRKMGAIDYLTGVKNRNSYETELPGYARLNCASLCCVFVDVNGLCQVNNAHGHKAGDKMLCTVAEGMRQVFREDFVYRMGGDEFVAFAPDSDQEDLRQRRQALDAFLESKGYSVSTGVACVLKKQDGSFDVDSLLAGAEADMYREKWNYYETNHIPSERDHFPTLN